MGLSSLGRLFYAYREEETADFGQIREKNISCYEEVFCCRIYRKNALTARYVQLYAVKGGSGMAEMTLREACKILGVTRRAVQGYEKAKLVSPTRKTVSGYLLYDESALERIRMIKLYQQMGFTIREIQGIVDAPKEVLKNALVNKKEKLNMDIRQKNELIIIIERMLEEL